MLVGVPRETFSGERRVAIVPDVLPQLAKGGMKVLLERGAGSNAGFSDLAYQEKGAQVAQSREEVFRSADLLVWVRGLGANPEKYRSDLDLLKPGQVVVGFLEPLSEPEVVQELSKRQITAFSMELVPRITRAQSMDALSSMASVAGYKAVLLAAEHLPRFFPMLMTAAGMIQPARVFVVGAGVTGLQAIATARRLGAVVQAYDVRPAAREEVRSLGAKFVELPLDTAETEDSGGYARPMDDLFYRKQADLMTRVIAESHVVVSTAAIPGKKAPVLITPDMVQAMAPGSVIVDVAAERGGNCALTRPGETVVEQGVTIVGPINLPSTVPYHASQMYSKNICNLLLHLVKDGQLSLNMEDEITRETLVAQDGQVAHRRVRKALGLEPVKVAE